MEALTSVMFLGMDWLSPQWLLDQYGEALFWISLVILFVECGLFFPFLPGDTLLFAMGLFISTGQIAVFPGGEVADLIVAMILMAAAAFAGNVTGYEIGRKLGPPLYERNGRIIKRKYFDATRDFFDTYGKAALVGGRFVAFVRTYITVVAGATRMPRRIFFFWSMVGAIIWVASISLLGYFLGNVDLIADNLELGMIAIMAVFAIPLLYEARRHRQHQ